MFEDEITSILNHKNEMAKSKKIPQIKLLDVIKYQLNWYRASNCRLSPENLQRWWTAASRWEQHLHSVTKVTKRQNYTRALNIVTHDILFEIVSKAGVGLQDKEIIIIKNIYLQQKAKVRYENETSDWIVINRSVRQCCILSPCRFNIYRNT